MSNNFYDYLQLKSNFVLYIENKLQNKAYNFSHFCQIAFIVHEIFLFAFSFQASLKISKILSTIMTKVVPKNVLYY